MYFWLRLISTGNFSFVFHFSVMKIYGKEMTLTHSTWWNKSPLLRNSLQNSVANKQRKREELRRFCLSESRRETEEIKSTKRKLDDRQGRKSGKKRSVLNFIAHIWENFRMNRMIGQYQQCLNIWNSRALL